MDLHQIRAHIDQVDQKLLRLLQQRMEYALRARKQKSIVHDPTREESVLRNVLRRSSNLLEYNFVAGLFHSIMEESKRVQENDLKLVAFQGEHGAWGELAARTWDPSVIPVPCREFAEVFKGIVDQEVNMGVVPIENSLEGAITEVNDLLVETHLNIIGEVNVPIHHNLLVVPGSNHRDIKVVYSHPQALAQCRSFLSRNKLEPRPFYDTAGAAQWLARERPTSTGGIASELASDLYGLEILKENIEDHATNTTRFVVLGNEPFRGGTKCTLTFSTQHKAGALLEVLRIFAAHGINLTRIESRPIRKTPGQFAFLVDFLGKEDDPDVTRALKEIRDTAGSYTILGFYLEAE